ERDSRAGAARCCYNPAVPILPAEVPPMPVPEQNIPTGTVAADPSATRSFTGEPETAAAVTIPAAVGRFTDLRPHAKGGIGEVFRATDTELRRPVALKRIQGRHAHRADSQGRFLREAELTARLE